MTRAAAEARPGEPSPTPGVSQDRHSRGQGFSAQSSYLAVNRLLEQGIPVARLDAPFTVGCGETLPAGAFFVPGGKAAERACAELAGQSGIEFCPLAAEPDGPQRILSRRRIGVYQRYWGGNMAEGWTGYVLEAFGFPYKTVMDEPFHAGRLGEEIDVLVLPGDRPEMIIGPAKPAGPGGAGGRRGGAGTAAARLRAVPVPPQYQSGIGDEGVAALAEFVRAGGRVVALEEATALVAQALALKLRNPVEGLDARAFFCKGSTLWVDVDPTHPLAYGMPARAMVLNVQSPAFEVLDGFRAEDYEVVVRYEREPGRLLQSGWLIGGEKIAGKPALVTVAAGRGDAVLIGFASLFRAQTHGTFKFLFNSLL